MQPEQQTVQPDYDFIFNSGQKKSRLKLNLAGKSFTTRIIVVAGGFLFLLIVFLVFKSILSGSSPATVDFDSIVAEQSQIIHIVNSDLVNQNTTLNNANQAFSQTALITMNSYRSSLLKFLSANGVKVGSAYLNYYNKQIDTQFSSAVTSANFNSVFQNVMSQQLINYNNDLIKTYSNVTNNQGRALLQSQYRGIQLLTRELNNQYS